MAGKKFQREAGPVAGSFQAPPPGAPQEIAQPLSRETVKEMLAKAQANEVELPPFNPQGQAAATGGTQTPTGVQEPAPVQAAGPASDQGPGPAVPAGPSGPGEEPPQAGPSSEPQTSAPAVNHWPAASNSDTPSRGQPHPSVDPGKQITGGFGMVPMGGQYFALDGTELRELVRGLMIELDNRLEADLRFSIALTYPQVRARLVLHIDGATTDAGINDVKFDLDALGTVETSRVDDDNTPPDAHRDELGLDKPFKHQVTSGAGRLLVDKEIK